MNECQYCHKTYSTRTNLVKHQNINRFCIQIQTANSEIIYKCDFCKVTFLNETNIKKHLCQLEAEYVKNKLFLTTEQLENSKNEIVTLKDRIVVLESKLESQAENIHNNSTNYNYTNIINYNSIVQNLQVLNLDSSKIKDIAEEHFSVEHLIQEHKGVAMFTYNHVIRENDKLKYICTDFARQNGLYIDHEGRHIHDKNMNFLASTMYDSIRDKVNQIVIDKHNEDTGYNETKENDDITEDDDINNNFLIVDSVYAKHASNLKCKHHLFKNELANFCYIKNINDKTSVSPDIQDTK
jgi:hypothetical protein